MPFPLLHSRRKAFQFTPLSIAGCQLWLDASQETYNDDDAVPTWSDRSGNLRHATQDVVGKRPVFKTNIVNGKPVIRYDGTNSALKLGDTLDSVWAAVDGKFTIYLVAYPEASKALIAKHSSADNQREWYWTIESGKLTAWIYGLDGAWYRGVYGNTAVGLNAWHLFGFAYDGSQDGNDGLDRFAFRLDGATEAPDLDYTFGALSDIPNGTAQLGAGCFVNVAGDTYPNIFDGDIAEVVVYDSALSATNRMMVESYLMEKYGL